MTEKSEDQTGKNENENGKEQEQKEIQTAKPILIKAEAYKTIILYASRYANQAIPSPEWKEIYGVLIGYIADAVVYVERAEALTFGHSTDVQLDQRHYTFIAEIEDKLYEENQGRFVVGWFHSHPGLGLFFSDIDIFNQLGFQARNPDSCGLVFDHTLLGKKKQEKVEGTEHMITKYDTGFEVYRLTDVSLDSIDDPQFTNNYHKVDYIIDGLNKFFFANVLAELSALATMGKPLQSAYGEDLSKYTPQFTQNPEKQLSEISENLTPIQESASIRKGVELEEIPIDDADFNALKNYMDSIEQIPEEIKDDKAEEIEQADKFIYEGNQAFHHKNSFIGVENYRNAIEIFKGLGEIDKMMEYLSALSEKCLINDHYPLAEEFSNELFKIAEERGSLFYMAGAKSINGNIKIGQKKIIEGLEILQQAAILYEKSMDYYGTGLCNQKIGSIYFSQLEEIESGLLFFVESVKNFNSALVKIHPLRKNIHSGTPYLKDKIKNLVESIRNNLNKITTPEVKDKIEKELATLR